MFKTVFFFYKFVKTGSTHDTEAYGLSIGGAQEKPFAFSLSLSNQLQMAEGDESFLWVIQ